MIISPPFLPASGLTTSDASNPDPMMDLIDRFEIGHHGAWPVTFDRRSHCAIHLNPGEQTEPVRAIADGEVVAYRICRNAISDGTTDTTTGQPVLNSNAGFVLLRHKTDTGDGRTITYYSLYMHLLDITNQEHIVPQPNDPPETGSANALPKWLLDTGGGKDGVVQIGGTKKVYRKDMLGYVGQHQGVAHLHFEIFMTDADFTAWFEKVQIGVKEPAQPTTGDYWGHSYFVISGPQEFYPQPAGTDEMWFPRVPGGSLGAGDTLYVEAWFNKGQRFTRVWIDKGGSGNVTLLTPAPIADPYDNAQKHYEYDMYERAMALYPACPSDGYEMLRFGRILSDHRTLTGAACATWLAVPFDENGTLGYINIAPDAIKKLSDADFPFFTGWQKVDGDNTPFSDAGRCDHATLCQLTGIQDPPSSAQPLEADPHNSNALDLQLASYVQNTEGVDAKLRGMVFKARSEWDSSNNEERYKDLNDPYGFFGRQKDTNPDGYAKFTNFLSKFQFLDKTPLAGEQLWFFHPLAFIRHFRKCGWLSKREILQLIPSFVIRKPGSHSSMNPGVWEQPSLGFAASLLENFGVSLNNSMRKFKLDTPLRRACFIGNATQETGWFHYLTEGNRSDNATDLHNGWFGRGFLQLTNPGGNMGSGNNNYYKYFKFIGRNPTLPPGPQELLWRNEIGRDAFHASHSAGAYWVWPNKSAPTAHNLSLPQVDSANKYADLPAVNERRTINTNSGIKVWYYNQSFTNCATAVNYPGATGRIPPNMNGLVDRSTSFVNALVVLTDVTLFKGQNQEDVSWPENFERRRVA
ncbi:MULTISPECIES: M23 family metallopeptidase [unclassified Caballeronia]|uniref:M23 family metallopeptidase n=1 Tax=unclassified Caballeronia TaxID=2646786 RepID=UPI00285D57A9|nr:MULTISPECIES: M23 family metallopeptidase [unclassified Caballeronia]MDR5777667.1 M23 family metallopeptidase [Caballeronia sp. LZ002]MDR5853105.1 M23 family metallopeptidase [Caballeronia sp. LZ003]